MKWHLWSRLVCARIYKKLCFYLIGFYLLYSMVDSTTHLHEFNNNSSLHVLDILCYYTHVCIKRLEILLPLAFMMALLKVLLEMNQKKELIALFTHGLKKTTFLKPILLVACSVSLILFLSFELLTPKALNYVESFERTYFHHHEDKAAAPKFLQLANHGVLIYSRHSSHPCCYLDVFYIVSESEIWKMDQLTLSKASKGVRAEHYIKQGQGMYALQEQLSEVSFENIEILYDSEILNASSIECGSFSFLYHYLKKIAFLDKKMRGKITTYIFFKLSVLLLPFLITIACIPLGLLFSRKLPLFVIYAMCIVGMIGYFLIMDAAIILGESLILPSWIAVFGPLLFILASFIPRFIRCCKN